MSRDLRKYAKQTEIQLIFLGIFLFFLVGIGLIYLLYGTAAAITGLISMAACLSPIILIIGAISLLDWIAKKNNA